MDFFLANKELLWKYIDDLYLSEQTVANTK